jgi:glycosyltransferase involved in cell wall biosynthesis
MGKAGGDLWRVEEQQRIDEVKLSLVVPIYNEEENVPLLISRTVQSLERIGNHFEIILVNDGSSDRSEELIVEAARKDARVKVINLRRNYGQTAAMSAGVDFAQGDVIIPMDGDLQNDPDDIPLLLAELDRGYDVVSGWRKDRKDEGLRRRFPSRVANWIISLASGVRLHDYGCTLKAYRRDFIKSVGLYGEMHRFIPIYARWHGARISEVVVRHHARRHGKSKYGLERVVKVVLDLLFAKFFQGYLTKPIYIFGGTGLFFLAASFVVLLTMIALRLFLDISMIATPLPLLAAICFISGVMGVLMGILAELVTRTYFESQGKPTYLVRDLVNIDAKR